MESYGMTEKKVVGMMRRGFELRNHGYGWFLTTDEKDFMNRVKVSEPMVNRLIKEGKLEVGTDGVIAKLTDLILNQKDDSIDE